MFCRARHPRRQAPQLTRARSKYSCRLLHAAVCWLVSSLACTWAKVSSETIGGTGTSIHSSAGRGAWLSLRNCPFDALSKDYRPVVCAMNRALIDGLLSGLGLDDITAVTQQRAGQCCVVLTRRADVAS